MSFLLLLAAISLCGGLAVLRLALRARQEAVRLRALNNALESRVAERMTELRRALDQASARALDLAAAQQARTDMLAAMNRELRTPLNAVIGFSELLALSTDDHPLTRRQIQAVEQIHAAGARLMRLVDHVLCFAELETGGPPPASQRIDPLMIVHQVIADQTGAAREAGVRIVAPPASDGFAVDADPGRLRRIVVALLSNAIRHNTSGGAAVIDVHQTPEILRITVHDTGPGLQPDRLARIFQPERRGDAGVSLAVSRRLAAAMGGALTAESIPGQGSSFILRLPGSAAPGRTASALPGPSPALAGAVVLCVDGDAPGRALMRHVVHALGGEAHMAETGETGLSLARDLRPDVIVMDPRLPDMDGFDLKARLDAEPLTRDLPVIGLSAAMDPALARRARTAGFAAWLAKPMDIGRMGRALADAVAAARSASAA